MIIFVANNLTLYLWSLVPDRVRSGVPDPLQVPVQTIVVPLALGLLAARLTQRRVIVRWAKGLGLYMADPSPTGWDYFFGRGEADFAIVGLKDGSRVGGYLVTNSMASSDSSDKNAYLEAAYRIPEQDGQAWTEIEGTRGMLSPCGEIQYSEFRAGDNASSP